MRRIIYLPLFLLSILSIFTDTAVGQSYKIKNPELGVVYRPINWDRQQWEEVFRDPAPPFAWAIMPVGRESCTAIVSWWLSGVRQKGLRPAVMLDPFLTKQEMEKTIDCSVALGIRRIIIDEYISYHSKNLGRNLCTVLREAREIYENAKRKYPGLQLDIDDNWQTWLSDLGPGQAASSCGSYPYFQYDQTGVSVLSKYGNPAQNGPCGIPTAEQMREQLIDLKPTVRDFSKTGKVFVWQLNQHWYPGSADVLQLFREIKKVYGWNRFLLFGPTTNNDNYGNWGYRASAPGNSCNPDQYQWYLPAREYLIRMTEGNRTKVQFTLPSTATRGSTVPVSGKILSLGKGLAVNNIELQISPPPGALQRMKADLTAPPKARLALLGIRVNLQTTNKLHGEARFDLERVIFTEKGKSSNLVFNSEINSGLDNWLVIATTPVTVGTSGSENYLQADCSANQSIAVTSIPVFVSPGRTYSVRFDARLYKEARGHGYFFVSWYRTDELQRDRIYMNFEDRKTVATASSGSAGNFQFLWQPLEPGIYTVSTFFKGNSAYQPASKSHRIEIN